MADPVANPEALTTLSAMVNQTLVETGRFFRSSGSMQARNQLKRSLPPTHEQFQSALDSLSEQIFIAKAFLEKDYEAAKEKRKALDPLPQPVPVEKPKVPEDIAMEDPTTALNREIPSTKTEEPLSHYQLSTQPSELHPQPPNDKTTDIPDPAKITPNDKPEPSVPVDDGAAGAPSADPQPPGDPASMDLDSMFPAGPGEGGNLDLSMEFPSDEAGDQNFLEGFSVGDSQNKNQDSMGSLLPGLENYANASGELNMNPPAGNDSAQVSPSRKDSMNNVPPGESNFDDLFMDAGNFGENSGEDLLNDDALVEIGDLDDSWLD